ncbi:MAG TPA: cytochrome c oxidase subunit II [Steroidobacteraceae bacterium]|nr:cytochrome c oxidase subunit II [Steroidobacteraceae bacterium]
MRVTRASVDHRTSRPRGFSGAVALFAAALAAFCSIETAAANTSNGHNLPIGVTDLSQSMYALHMEVFWICVGIAVVVFGAMIYSLVKFRRSQGAVPDTTMVHSTKVEIIWTIIPVIILVVMAVPAADLILKQEDTRNSELSIRVTGYQWKWQYQYMDAADGVDFFSTLKQDSNFARQLNSGVDPKTVTNYLLDVDKPMVIPSGTKVRLLLTSMDVIHAWWVPDFGAKRSAIPGFVNELWFKVDAGKEGIYRGQCAALCGRDHGFMPVVVDVRTPDDFKKWVEEQKAALKQAGAPAAGSPVAGSQAVTPPAAGSPPAAAPPAAGSPAAVAPAGGPPPSAQVLN